MQGRTVVKISILDDGRTLISHNNVLPGETLVYLPGQAKVKQGPERTL